MIRFDQDELDSLVETLRKQPGFITAAVVPPGSGDALVERLGAELGDLRLEQVAAHLERPIDLGTRAAGLGSDRDGFVFILRLDETGLFDSEDDAVRFWEQLNYQREALGSGSVRTCLLLNEVNERGLAIVADDLWDWVTVFRFPEASRVSIRTPEDSEDLVWTESSDRSSSSESELTILRDQRLRALRAGVPAQTFLEIYAVPFFLALPESLDDEAIDLWNSDLRRREDVAKLPAEMRLAVARKMTRLALRSTGESPREELLHQAVAAADGAVVDLERKAAARPEAFEPGLAAALSVSAKIHQDAGDFETALARVEKCLDLLRSLDGTVESSEAHIKAHVRRRWSLLFLLRAWDNRESSVVEQIEILRGIQGPELDAETKSKAFGAALELSITRRRDPIPGAHAALFTAWVLSDEARLQGPRFDEILAQDPESYFRGFEALWQLKRHTPWKKLLLEPLIREWTSQGPTSDRVREELTGWLLHFSEDNAGRRDLAAEDRRDWWTGLQWIAVRILGYRYEPALLRTFCRYVASLPGFDEKHGIDRHRAIRHLGFMLRWSYQEQALRPLEKIAADPESQVAEIEAAIHLASELRQAELPASLSWQPEPVSFVSAESPADQLRRGDAEFLLRMSPGEFCERAPHLGIAELAGDPEIPDLDLEEQRALATGLRALVKTGRVRDDGGQQTGESWIFDAWIPWLARSDEREWWGSMEDLILRQIELPNAQWALQQFPVLGLWVKDESIAGKLEEKLIFATGSDGEELRGNWGLLELLRWALHLEDAAALLRCCEALAVDQEYVKLLTIEPIPWVLRWALDRPAFEAAGKRRREASNEVERRLWFLVEWPFVDRLAKDEALAWFREVAPLVARWDDLSQLFIDQLAETDDSQALEMLLDGGIKDLKDRQVQGKILALASHRGELDQVAKRYPHFVSGLSPTLMGSFLSEAGRIEEFRGWGHEFLAGILARLPEQAPVEVALVFSEIRRALHRWAHLEPKAFLAAAEKIVAMGTGDDWLRFRAVDSHWTLLEAVLIVWQDLEPLAAAEARTRLKTGWFNRSWSTDGGIPAHVRAAWDLEFCGRPEHRALRLVQLRNCISDKEIALHGFAARVGGMLDEVEAVSKELLSLDRQLDRALGVSLLAWHPQGDRWLRQLSEEDPSSWVRQHAEWGIGACRRERLGRDVLRRALEAKSWIEQQAHLEQLVPLVLPTFPLWLRRHDEFFDLVTALEPRRRALLIDFNHTMRKQTKWQRVLGRDLEKYCRGEEIRTHLDLGEKGPPWQSSRTFSQK